MCQRLGASVVRQQRRQVGPSYQREGGRDRGHGVTRSNATLATQVIVFSFYIF
jgi:hypothetical protein